MKAHVRRSTVPAMLAISGAIAAFSHGCVSLEKPGKVQACANSSAGCSDDNAPSSRDAAVDASGGQSDGGQSGDTAIRTGADAQPDLASPGSPDGPGAPDKVSTALEAQPYEAQAPDGTAGAPDLRPPADLAILDQMPADLLADLPADLPADLATDRVESVPDVFVGRDVPADGPGDTTSDQATNCVSTIVANGYKAGTAPACSACTDGNGGSLATKCEKMLDCLDAKGTPALTDCLNAVAGSSLVSACVTALTKAAGCPAGYY